MNDFRNAITFGIVLCWCLNLAWCYFVLHIVPQTGEPLSLKHSASAGEISTVPVVESIEKNAPQYMFVGKIVNSFIMLSLTVSFCTLGIGMMHVLRGIAESSLDPNSHTIPSPTSGTSTVTATSVSSGGHNGARCGAPLWAMLPKLCSVGYHKYSSNPNPSLVILL